MSYRIAKHLIKLIMKIIKGLLVFIGVFFIFYLLGAFCSVSFDLSKWDKDSRSFITYLGVIVGFSAILIYIDKCKSV